MYISITGLKPKGALGFFRFWLLAVPSFRQAQNAKGNLFCSVKRIQGQQCTLTAWESRDIMLEFMRSGAHLKAMKQFHKIASGKTYGYESTAVPNWTEAFNMLQDKGKAY
jgi:hypothetical protein